MYYTLYVFANLPWGSPSLPPALLSVQSLGSTLNPGFQYSIFKLMYWTPK